METWTKMYQAAKAVQNDRKVSEYIEAGGVAAAVLSGSGKIYTGVCIDTCSTLGICAERNAIFNMITCGEQEIKRVLAIEVLMDYESKRIVTLGELTPEWWI